VTLHSRIATTLFIAIALSGCRGIPELAFDSDAGDDASRIAPDAQSDGTALVDSGIDESAIDTHDASGSDARSDADIEPVDANVPDGNSLVSSGPDSSFDAAGPYASGGDDGGLTCPAGPPPGASVCCKGVPCRGAESSCNTECTNCANNCGGQTCCLDSNGNFHGCAKKPADCP
jgi:hypothetical protein